MGAFVGDQKKFDRPVAVEILPGSGVMALGFVTRGSLEPYGLAGRVAVYLPQSYNFAGQLLLVPEERVSAVAADSSEVMTLVVSGGVAGK
jgi:uncharacterized membrane protein